MNNEVGRAVKTLDQLIREVKALKATPRLASSSLEDAAVNEYAGDQLVSTWGRQYDGTHGTVKLSGPTPPTPTAPTVRKIAGGFVVTVPGEWVQTLADAAAGRPTVAPLDFARYEIHISLSPTATVPAFNTLKAVIPTARGGDAAVFLNTDLDGAGYYFRVFARSETGKASLASDPTGPLQPGLINPEDLDIDFDSIGGNTISQGPDQPTSPKIGDLWLKEVVTGPPKEYETRRYDGNTWQLVVDQKVTDALETALAAGQAADNAAAAAAAADVKAGNGVSAANTAQLTANGRAQLFVQDAQPADLASTARGVWVETDQGNRIWDWSGSAWTLRRFGNASIQPNSLVAKDVVATGTVTAALLEALMVLATTIIAGNPAGAHARMTPTGFRVYAADIVNGGTREVIRLGTDTNDYFGIISAIGELLASVTEQGVASFQGLSVRTMPSFGGYTLQSLLDEKPRGLIAWGTRDFSGGISGIIGEEPLFDVAANLEPNRMYLVRLSGYDTNVSGGATQTVVHRVRVAYDGTTPSINSPIVMSKQQSAVGGLGMAADFQVDRDSKIDFAGTSLTKRVARFQMSIGKGGNTGNSLGLAGLISLAVYDMGPIKPSVVTNNPGGQGWGNTNPAPTQPIKNRYVLERVANWSRSFTPGNGINDDANVYQGYNAATGGDMGGMWGFSDMAAELTGAAIETIDVYLYASHWYYNAGGTAIISTHAQLNKPSTWSKYESDPDNLVNFGKPEGKWVGLDVNRYAARLQNGQFRGITVGRSGGTNQQYYGRFHGASDLNPARIRVGYVK